MIRRRSANCIIRKYAILLLHSFPGLAIESETARSVYYKEYHKPAKRKRVKGGFSTMFLSFCGKKPRDEGAVFCSAASATVQGDVVLKPGLYRLVRGCAAGRRGHAGAWAKTATCRTTRSSTATRADNVTFWAKNVTVGPLRTGARLHRGGKQPRSGCTPPC